MGSYFGKESNQQEEKTTEQGSTATKSNSDDDNEKEFLVHFKKAQELHQNSGKDDSQPQDSEKLLEEINLAIQAKDDVTDAFVLRGIVYRDMVALKMADPQAQNEQLEPLVRASIDDFNAALRVSKNQQREPFVFLSRGMTLQLIGENQKAISDYSRALELLEADLPALEQQLLKNAKKDGADDNGGGGGVDDGNKEQILKLKQIAYGAHFNRGITFLSMASFDDAILDLTKALKFEKFKQGPDNLDSLSSSASSSRAETDPTIYINRAGAYLQKGSLDKAIDDYSAAIKRIEASRATPPSAATSSSSPSSAAVERNELLAAQYANRGQCYLQKKEFGCAYTDFDTCIKHFKYDLSLPKELQSYPDNAAAGSLAATYYARRGEASLYSKKIDPAMEDFNTAIRIDPECLDAWKNRGMMFKAMGS